MKKSYLNRWGIFVVLLSLILTACGATTTETSTPTPAPPETEVPATATTLAMGRINGRIEFQGPPTPATVLYVVNENDTSQWYTRELAGSDGATPFEIEVPAGSYQVYARQVDGPMVAAYLNPDETLGAINVSRCQKVPLYFH